MAKPFKPLQKFQNSITKTILAILLILPSISQDFVKGQEIVIIDSNQIDTIPNFTQKILLYNEYKKTINHKLHDKFGKTQLCKIPIDNTFVIEKEYPAPETPLKKPNQSDFIKKLIKLFNYECITKPVNGIFHFFGNEYCVGSYITRTLSSEQTGQKSDQKDLKKTTFLGIDSSFQEYEDEGVLLRDDMKQSRSIGGKISKIQDLNSSADRFKPTALYKTSNVANILIHEFVMFVRPTILLEPIRNSFVEGIGRGFWANVKNSDKFQKRKGFWVYVEEVLPDYTCILNKAYFGNTMKSFKIIKMYSPEMSQQQDHTIPKKNLWKKTSYLATPSLKTTNVNMKVGDFVRVTYKSKDFEPRLTVVKQFIGLNTVRLAHKIYLADMNGQQAFNNRLDQNYVLIKLKTTLLVEDNVIKYFLNFKNKWLFQSFSYDQISIYCGFDKYPLSEYAKKVNVKEQIKWMENRDPILSQRGWYKILHTESCFQKLERPIWDDFIEKFETEDKNLYDKLVGMSTPPKLLPDRLLSSIMYNYILILPRKPDSPKRAVFPVDFSLGGLICSGSFKFDYNENRVLSFEMRQSIKTKPSKKFRIILTKKGCQMTFNQNSKIDRQDVLFTIDFNSKNEIVVSDIDRDVSVESLHYKFPDDRQHFWIYLQKDILTIGTGDELVSASQILLTYQHEKLQQVNSFMFDKIYSSNVQIHHQLILSQKLELVEELNQLLNDKSFQDLVNEKPMLKEANMLLGDPCYEKPDFSMIVIIFIKKKRI